MGSPKNRSIKYSLSEGLEKVPHVLKKKMNCAGAKRTDSKQKKWKCCCKRETASSYQSIYSQRLFLWVEEVGWSRHLSPSSFVALKPAHCSFAPSHGHSASTATKVVPNWAPRMVSSTLKKLKKTHLPTIDIYDMTISCLVSVRSSD